MVVRTREIVCENETCGRTFVFERQPGSRGPVPRYCGEACQPSRRNRVWKAKYVHPDGAVNPKTGRPYASSNRAHRIAGARRRLENVLAARSGKTVDELLAWCDQHHRLGGRKRWTVEALCDDTPEAKTVRAALWEAHPGGRPAGVTATQWKRASW